MDLANILEKFDYFSIRLPGPDQSVVIEDDPDEFLVITIRSASPIEENYYKDNI